MEQVTAWLIGATLALGAALALARARRWADGRPARVRWVRGLLRLPLSYFVDLHHVVAREAYAARMHVAVAGGFVGAVILVVLVHLGGLRSQALAWVLLALLILMLAGALLVAGRRMRPLARLSRGGFSRLPFSLMAFAIFFILMTLPLLGLLPRIAPGSAIGVVVLLLGVWGCLEMFAFFPVGPMKHAFAGAAHLAFHPRPGRLGAKRPDAALRLLDLDVEVLGVERPVDFAWNQLLSFDACVQCGKCEAACPAFAAGQPLNPKKLIQDLARAMDGTGHDGGYRGSPHPGREVGGARGGPYDAIVGADAMIAPETLWSCTTCRACVYECPMLIEHVDAILDLRRFETLEKGAVPGKGGATLTELREADNPAGRALGARLDWAADLSLPVLSKVETCDTLLWLGDGAFDLRNQRTLRALVRLLRRAEVDIAVLGAEELDCGDIARRLGDEATFQDLARRNIATLAKYGFKRIVTCDPHAFNLLANEYPALGGVYEVLHHTQLLASLLDSGRLVPGAGGVGGVGGVTYHDPCYLGRYNGETNAPRAILDAIGVERVEMERSGMRSMCCGGGGGAPLTDIPGERRIPDMRMDQVRETGAGILAVACPNCAAMLEGVVGPRPEVMDVAELLLKSVEEGA
jgi:Fe-S oxidoreductase